jgi:hypothetical protein
MLNILNFIYIEAVFERNYTMMNNVYRTISVFLAAFGLTGMLLLGITPAAFAASTKTADALPPASICIGATIHPHWVVTKRGFDPNCPGGRSVTIPINSPGSPGGVTQVPVPTSLNSETVAPPPAAGQGLWVCAVSSLPSNVVIDNDIDPNFVTCGGGQLHISAVDGKTSITACRQSPIPADYSIGGTTVSLSCSPAPALEDNAMILVPGQGGSASF